MRQKQWVVIFRQWPTPPVDLLHACRPDNLQVVPNKGSANLIAQRKRAAGIHPSKPAWTPPPPPPPPPPVVEKPRNPSLAIPPSESTTKLANTPRNVPNTHLATLR